MTATSPLKACREKCMDCCCGSYRAVGFCPATKCALWPFRFGMMPKTAARKVGKDLLTPATMQDAHVMGEDGR